MGSRMMHYAIANLILDKLEVKDRNKFLIGSLAPDMVDYDDNRNAKKRAHFYVRYKESGIKGYDWITFYNKYLKENRNDEFALGYLVHLICDGIWITDIQVKYRYSTNKEIQKEKIIQGYEDMRKSNYHISQNFKIAYDIKPLEKFSLDEVNIAYQQILLNDLKEDFLSQEDDLDFKILNWQVIVDYIYKCAAVCIRQVTQVMNGMEPDDPVKYMIPIDLK